MLILPEALSDICIYSLAWNQTISKFCKIRKFESVSKGFVPLKDETRSEKMDHADDGRRERRERRIYDLLPKVHENGARNRGRHRSAY